MFFDEFPITYIKEEEIPLQLREIPRPPHKLSIRGKLPPTYNTGLCVVGSRKYSSYGKMMCEKIIEGLKGYPITIISGLALGIDGIAHTSAIKAGLSTLAVPGSGLCENVLYPRSHFDLALSILKNNGCLLSEFEDDFKATFYSFPQRNRIMAGLSKAILVIECEKKSGTLITARLATDYNRDVLTIPGDVTRDTSEGPLILLKLGATPVSSAKDVLEALGFAQKEESAKKEYTDLNHDEQYLLSFLQEPKTRDEIMSLTLWNSQKLSQTMTILEIKEIIKEEYGYIKLL